VRDTIQQAIRAMEWMLCDYEHLNIMGEPLSANWPQRVQSVKDAVAALQDLQSGEPVVFTCHGNNAPAYGCNKPGDMSGTYYKAPQPVVPEGYVLVPRAAVTEVLRISDRQHPAWEEVRTALLRAGKGGDSDAPEMKTYRCVTCNVSGTDDGLCDAHKYDEQLSKHKSAAKEAGKGGES
jgi:hypothetical protein